MPGGKKKIIRHYEVSTTSIRKILFIEISRATMYYLTPREELKYVCVVDVADFGYSAKLTTDKNRRATLVGTPFWMVQ
jgi:hypothetical protein